MATVTSSKRHLQLTSDTYESNGVVTIGGDNLYFDGSNTYLRSDNQFRFLTDGGAAQVGKFKSLQVSTSYSGTPPDQGILFGTDTNLYRSAANTLKTDDSFIVGGTLTALNEVHWDLAAGEYAGDPRAVAFGYSGGNYGQLGYGLDFTTTSGTHTYAINDIATRVDLHNGLVVYSSVSGGTVGSNITWTEVLEAQADAFQYKGNNIWHAGNDGASSGLDADTLDTYHASSFLLKSGGTMAGNIAMANYNITGVNQLEFNDPGEGIVFKQGSSGDISLVIVDDSNDNILRLSGTGAQLQIGTNRVLTTADEGSGNGLDADTLDGNHASAFLTSLPSHTHDDRYYTETEIDSQNTTLNETLAHLRGWVPGYSNSTDATVRWNRTEDALELQSSTDTAIGAVYQARRIENGETVRFTIMVKGSVAASNGLYLRLYQHDGDMPDGKTHVSNDAGGTYVQEDDRGDTGWYENSAITTSWVTFEREYTAPADGYVSLVVLNWSGIGTNSVYLKTPDIQTIKAANSNKLNGQLGSYYLNTSSTAQTKSGDLTADQFISTNNGSGTNYRVGDDAWIGDINVANTLRVSGVQNANNGYITFGNSSNDALGRAGTGALTWAGNTIWHAGNDGGSSGLDADTLDTYHASSFIRKGEDVDTTLGNSTDNRAKVLTLNHSHTNTFAAASDISDTNRVLTIQNPNGASTDGLYTALHMQVLGNAGTTRAMGDIKFVRESGYKGSWYFTSKDTAGDWRDGLKVSTDGITVEGSGSTVFDVQGSQGQLFSITDDLTGDLFSVSDISGVPILNVNASGDSYFDGNVALGDSTLAGNAAVTVSGSMTFGIPGNGSNTNGRYISIEGNADSSGEGSGRIFFTEHNSSTTSMDAYGMSIGYRGGGTTITGASGNSWTGLSSISNGQWGMWGHDNNADGALIMYGDRGGTFVDFAGNNIQGITDIYVADQILHTGDTNTYMQFHAADQWRVVTGGAERLEVNNSATTLQNKLVLNSVGATTTGTTGLILDGGEVKSRALGSNAFNSTAFLDAHPDTSTLSGTYGSTSNGTKIDQITVDANGHITAITTGGTGDINGVTAGTGLSGGGTSGTPTLNSVYLPAVDDRDVKPTATGIVSSVKGIKPFFTTFNGMTGTQGGSYLDMLALDTYSDSSAGGPNAITFHKDASEGDPKMYIWKAAWNGTTWGTGQRVFADNYHPNADKWTTARTITIGSTGKTVDGTGNVSWTLGEIGAAASSHNHSAADITSGTFSAARIAHNSFDIGDTTAETGRSVHETGIYTFNRNNGNLGTGTNTSYYSVLAYGQGAGGSAQIATEWTNGGNKLYFRSLRDTTDNWWDWKEIYHTGHKPTLSELGAAASSHNHDDRYYTESESNTRYLRRDDGNNVDIRLDSSDGRGLRFWDSNNYKIYMSSTSNGTWGGRVGNETTSDYNMYFRMSGGTNRGFVFRNGTNNMAGIDASGNGRFEGDVIAYSSSDRRYKDNLLVIGNATDKIKQLSGYEFTWNDKQTTYKEGTKDVGVVAQEVEKILPEVVTTRQDGYKAVKYEKIVPLLIEGIKEQQKQIDELKAIVNKLQNEK